jgi:adenylate cyclase
MAAAQDFPADSGAAPVRPAHPWIARLSAYDGRAAALALLIAMGLGFARYGETLWNPWRNIFFDGYQRLQPRAVLALPAVIVAIDEQSLAAFGRWPWPRTRLAQLIEATHRLGALAVGLDMILADADNQSPQQLLAERSNVHPTLSAALAALPSNDAILTAVMSRVPTVVGRAARADSKTGLSPGIIQTPMVTVGASPGKFVPNYTGGQLANLPELDQAAAGRGYLNDGRNSDGFVRSIPLILSINGTLAPAFASCASRLVVPPTYQLTNGGLL